jgi:sugar lactone lactonase YvrE
MTCVFTTMDFSKYERKATNPTPASRRKDLMLSYQRVISTAFISLSSVCLLAGLAAGAAAQLPLYIPPIVFAGVQSIVPTTGLAQPSGLTVDSKGNLYIADTGNDRVVEITTAGAQKTVVSGVVAGAKLKAPTAVAVGPKFAIYIADPNNNRVLEVTPGGKASLIGKGLSQPSGVAVDAAGNVYIADTDHDRVVEVSKGVQTVAVTSDDLSVNLSKPDGISVWTYYGANLVVSDSGAGAIVVFSVNQLGSSGMSVGEWSESYGFGRPIAAIAANPTTSYAGDLSIENDQFGYGLFYVVDAGTHGVWAESCPPCIVEYIDYEVSQNNPGPQFSSNPVTGVSSPGGIAADPSGNIIYISDSGTNRILKLTTGNSVDFGSVAVGESEAPIPLTLSFTAPTKMTMPSVVTKGAANKDFKLADSGTCKIGATYEGDTNCTLDVIFSPRFSGERDGALNFAGGSGGVTSTGTVYLHGLGKAPQIAYGPGVQTTLAAGFKDPRGVAVDGNGNAYVADNGDGEIYEVTPAGAKRAFAALKQATTLAMDGAGNLYTVGNPLGETTPGIVEIGRGGHENDLLTSLTPFPDAHGLAVDGSGDVFSSDGASAVWEIAFSGNSSPIYAGCYPPTHPACLFPPGALAVDGSGDLYVVDLDNSRVWKITPKGEKSTVGSGFSHPQGLAVDGEGNVYVADSGNDRVVQITPDNKQSTVGSNLSEPTAVAVDAPGNIYVTDAGNGRLVKIDRTN